jgi:hypothetical protein
VSERYIQTSKNFGAEKAAPKKKVTKKAASKKAE